MDPYTDYFFDEAWITGIDYPERRSVPVLFISHHEHVVRDRSQGVEDDGQVSLAMAGALPEDWG